MTAPRPPVLLTRPARVSQRFAAALADRVPGVRIVVSPVVRIVPREVELPLDRADVVVLTSENGVAALAGRNVRGMRAYCVGDRTAAAAAGLGLDAVSAAGDADRLVALIRNEAPAGRLLVLRGAESRGAVAERLEAAGFAVESRVVYDQQCVPLSEEARRLVSGDAPVVAPVFSPRSADRLGAAWGRAPVLLFALSPAVVQGWSGPGPALVRVAQRPEAAAILRLLQAHFRETAP